VGGPQISFANEQICKLTVFVKFADIPQMWQFADVRFAGPIFYEVCDLKLMFFGKNLRIRYMRTGISKEFADLRFA
jgi:hypothetical protein